MKDPRHLQFVFLGIGALLILLAVPLIDKRIGPNRFYGVRTRKTLSDPAVWYEANRIGGWDLAFAGVFIFLSTGFLILFGPFFFRPETQLFMQNGVAVGALIVSTIHTLLAIRNL